VRSDPLSGFSMESFEIHLELVLVDAPNAPAPKFYGGQLVTSYERVDLGDTDVEIGSDLLERHESGRDALAIARVLRTGHGGTLANIPPVWLHWPVLSFRGIDIKRRDRPGSI
jgi:hypothetical protein